MTTIIAVCFVLFSCIAVIVHDFFWRFRQRLDLIPMLPLLQGAIVLTFDDGPDSHLKAWGDQWEEIARARDLIEAIDPDWDFQASITQNLARTLQEFGVSAIFFVQGQVLAKDEATHPVLHDLAKRGHSIGNHFFSHTRYREQTATITEKEIRATDDLIKKITARQTHLYRPPYGQWTILRSIRLRFNRHLSHYFLPLNWTHCSFDWEKPIETLNRSNLKQQVSDMLDDIETRPGPAIILQHDVWAYSALFTRLLLQRLRQQSKLTIINPKVILQTNSEVGQGFWWLGLTRSYLQQRSRCILSRATGQLESPLQDY